MIISRKWAMPSKWTFEIPPIQELINRHISGLSVDPFAGRSKIATYRNDLDPDNGQPHTMDAVDFLKQFDDGSISTVLFDPPYSPRQVSECYKKLGKTVNMQTTQSSFYRKAKVEISRITSSGGKAITFGWNSGGVGKKYGFEIVEILLVAHGGNHNDTIIVVEERISDLFNC